MPMEESTGGQIKAAENPLQLRNSMGEVFISLIPKEQYIEARWQGHLTADDVIAAAKAYLAYIQQNPCPKLLNDKSAVTGDWIDANAWLEFEWIPKVVEAGLRCITHVYSANGLSQLSARDLYHQASPFLHMENFSDRDQAVKWLLACDPTLPVASS